MRSGTIRISHPNGYRQELPLDHGTLRLGSAPDNDLIITGPDIAPHHATISCGQRGRLVVEVSGENIAGQGGMRLTFNLSQITRRRDLAWFSDYVVSYYPATWECQTQPLRPADLPASEREVGATPTARRSADETALLSSLLGQGFAGQSHEAATLVMPLMALSACEA